MNELEVSDIQYQIIKMDNKITIKCENPLNVKSTIFDKINNNWIFAVKVNDKNYEKNRLYYIDYLYLSENFDIVKVIRENRGVMPTLITAPDNKVWVSLSSIATEKNGEVVLSLENRSAITKDIVKKDIGFSHYFNFCGYAFGYYDDIFSKNKPDQLALYEFDKKGLYKNRTMKKLTDIFHGTPCVLMDKFFVTSLVKQNEFSKIKLYELNQKREIINEWESEPLSDVWYAALFSVSDNGYSFLTHYQNRIDIINFDVNGRLLDKNVFYESNTRINTIKLQLFDNDSVAVQFYREQACNGLICYFDGVKDIFYQSEPGMLFSAIDSKHILKSSYIDNILIFEIIFTENFS